ncbi:E3 ubiquitin-protein ligase MARCH2 [Papilio machaon]|uniref:E3 ubiquitin-protein ligase MARCH2 n=1 Tax=Papilio machaon TaxID=76193 RepID=A0A194RHL4_PAPMA|nr:E3 ubiquitin-protein ligase MARCH2 [Papilio machaon]
MRFLYYECHLRYTVTTSQPGAQGNQQLRSTGQQTDITCGYSSFASPVVVGEAESQRALRERLADSLTFAAPPSPPPARRSASILGSVCALLLRKQGSSGAGAIAGKEASVARSRQSGSICRICFGGASRERLARPCACRGTVAAVHRSCLERWLLQAATSHCELCRYHYVVTRTHKSLLASYRQTPRPERPRPPPHPLVQSE